MDFHALSRRELQALCKRNAIRANMTNAAMAEALQSLPSVDGIDEIGRTAPPAMSAMKPAEEATGEEQRHECPLPRGSRAQAKTRRAAAHKTEEAVPPPAALQGSQRTAAPVDVEEEPTAKRRTRRSTRSKVKRSLDQKEEVAAAAAGKESIADNSNAALGSAVQVSDQSCDDPKEEQVAAVVDEVATKPHKGTVDQQEPISTVHKSASMVPIEDSPILGVMSKTEATEHVIEMEQDASVGDGEGFTKRSSAREMTDDINPVIEEKAVAADDEAVKEDGFTTGEADQSNLLVNTLDRFVKPMYEFTVKKKKKEGECWWMLM